MADNLVKYILSVDTQGAVVGLDKVESGAKKTGKELDKTKDKGKKACSFSSRRSVWRGT